MRDERSYEAEDMAVVLASKEIAFVKDDEERHYVISNVTFVEDRKSVGPKHINISLAPIFSEE